MIYLVGSAVFAWLCVCSLVGLGYSAFRFRSRDVDYVVATLFYWGASKIAGVRVEIEGRENLSAHQPCIYVGNHQSLLDVLTFAGVYPRRTVIVGKKELIWIPIFGIFWVAAGNILLDRWNRRHALKTLAHVVERIRKERISVFIFPEGTRSGGGDRLLRFKKGAFHMAIETGLPIVPLVSAPTDSIFDATKRRLIRNSKVVLRVLPPVPSAGRSQDQLDRYSDEVRSRMLEALHDLSVKSRSREGNPPCPPR